MAESPETSPTPPVLGYAEPGSTADPGRNERLVTGYVPTAATGAGVCVGCALLVTAAYVTAGPAGAALAAVAFALPATCGTTMFVAGVVG